MIFFDWVSMLRIYVSACKYARCFMSDAHSHNPFTQTQAWIQNLTVRQCILFGKPYVRTKYHATLAAAQLKTDLENLTAGDATEIGERGINLSGGQKARISLARAIYADADVVIMDDPLSAVDAHVSRAIFDEAICDQLASKTRLLILSSNYHLLSAADQILILEGGRVVGSGSFQKLAPKFPQYFKKPASPVDPLPVLCTQMSKSAACFDRLPSMVMVENDEPEGWEGKENGTAALGALIGKEDREVGSVSMGVYIQYFAGATKTRAGGICLALSLLLIFGLGQAMRVMVDLWLTRAAEAISGETTNKRDLARSMDFWVGVYWTFAILTVGLALLRSRMLLWASIRSCSRLHDRLMRGVLRAPVNMYFDVVPLGRILNRFSKDLDHVDQVLPDNVLQFLQNSIFVLSILGLCFSSSLWFILFFAPIIVIFYAAYLFFRKTSREVKRLEGVSRSPIYSSFSEMLQGLVSIRAFRRNQDFVTRHYDAVDHNTSLFLLFWLTSRWLAIRLDMLSTAVMLVLAFLGVTLCNLGEENEERIQMSPSILGLALIYTLQLTGLLQWTVRLVVETENSFTAVERLVTFLELPEEAPEVTAVRPPQEWPQFGAIEIENLSLRYRQDLDTILTNLSLSIQAGDKVGIVGRTGAGKSSLGQAIFRMVEAEPGGSIVIDGIDIATLGLNDLRSRLTVIPQDPVVFSGTVRFNLDPLGQSDDASIW
jgi:ABC-type multidrug transport system fused ATPase/permease subunit